MLIREHGYGGFQEGKEMKRRGYLSGKTTRGLSQGLGCVGAFLLSLAFLFSASMACDVDIHHPDEVSPAKPEVTLREQWGVEVNRIRLSAAGRVLDFRYRVLDPQKALAFLGPKQKPTLIDQASGVKLSVPVMPKVGALRQKTIKPEAGRIYFILFGNPGVVKEGSKVTLVIGDVKVENLTVEGEP